MPGTLTISYEDAQGTPATNSFTVADAAAGAVAVPKFKALTNCKILAANYSEAMDISGLAGNANPTAANNESARTKAVVTMSGPPPAAGLKRIQTTLEIPAPLGSLISGAVADRANALITTLLASVLTNRGETLDTIDNIDYAR